MKPEKKWPPRFRKRSPFGKKRPVNTVWMEEYEHALILSDMAHWDPGAIITTSDLFELSPSRYSKRYLKGTLDRMVRRGIIQGGGRGSRWTRGSRYVVPERVRQSKAA